MTKWECVGPVRGRCGVQHQSEDAAAKHCELDGRQVRAGHGQAAYSDRRPVEVGQQARVDGLIS